MARLEQDDKLQFETDKSGMIHVRKNTQGSKVLPGYGTRDFGVSSYESNSMISAANVISAAGIVGAGLLLWKFRSKLQVLSDYALLLREASRG